jgi:hypothetical protein
MRKLTCFALAAALVAASVMPAEASAKARGRWEGLAIGLGAVSLYNLFSYGTFSPVVPPGGAYGAYSQAPTVVYQQPTVVYQQPAVVYQQAPVVYGPPSNRPVYEEYEDDCRGPETVWVPGHWRTRRHWVPGHWEYR